MPDKDNKGDEKVLNCVIDGKYLIEKRIGGGAFGSIYSGIDLQNEQILAIKLEEKDSEAPQLPLEYRFYILIGEHSGLPKIYHFGPVLYYHALVLEMLGPSLEQMHDLCKNKFTPDTTAKIGLQIIEIIEFVHSKRIIYRDIKPENFLLGRPGTPKENKVSLVDFGLAKEYINMQTGKHIPMKTGKQLIGTPRYMSTWTHCGKEHSRRDDLESIGFMLVYFLKSRLPWQGLKGKHRYEMIGKVKIETPIHQLCSDLPQQFAQYCTYVRGLDFEAEPNYQGLVDLFKSLANPQEKYNWMD